MARYGMSDGTVVDTANASASYEESTRFDGRNHISLATGTQWDHETLYRSRKGRYYVEHMSQWQGTTPRAEWVSNEAAVRWLLTNEHEIPADLKPLVDSVTE